MEYVLMLETKQVLHFQGTQWLMVAANVAVEEDSCLLECYTMSFGKWLPTFLRHHAALKYWKLQLNNTQHSIRFESSSIQLLAPHISHCKCILCFL
jgi:hypothetical protein